MQTVHHIPVQLPHVCLQLPTALDSQSHKQHGKLESTGKASESCAAWALSHGP